MVYKFDEIVREVKDGLKDVNSLPKFETYKAKFLGPKGSFRELMRSLADLPKEERPKVGQSINACKIEIEELFRQKLEDLENIEDSKILGLKIDPNLTGSENSEVFCHPLTKIKNRIIEIFSKIGFSVAEGTEIETEWFCFDALNTDESHPSRDDRDTFYFDDDVILGNISKRSTERYLLRTHTSTVQIRTMLKNKPPIRILSPGLVFRKDAIDATHSPNFHQCEGLVVDKNISVCDLKSCLDFFFTELVGEGCEIRMRPSYFPFVSPGFEVDFRSKNIGKLSDRWIEAGGCGMVSQNVFKNCGYNDITGFAFGMGIERLAMLLYGVDDIRLFFQNDTRFLKQFKAA